MLIFALEREGDGIEFMEIENDLLYKKVEVQNGQGIGNRAFWPRINQNGKYTNKW